MHGISKASFHIFFLFFVIFSLFGCGPQDGERQEQLTKLRALGVKAQKPVLAPGETGKLTFYLALPLGKQASFITFIDRESLYSLPIQDLEISENSQAYTDFQSFRTFLVEASFVVPAASILGFTGKADDVARLRYGVEFSSDSEVEKVVGDVIVRPVGASEQSFKNPEVEILGPSTYAAEAELSLKGSVVNLNHENLRLAWFVGGGEVQNRRALETSWKTGKEGKRTVVFTARGVESRGFGIHIRDL